MIYILVRNYFLCFIILMFIMLILSLCGECLRIFFLLVEIGFGGIIISVLVLVGLLKCSVVVVILLFSIRVCFLLFMCIGIGWLVLLLYVLVVIIRLNFFGSGCLYLIFILLFSCVLD